MTLNVSALPTAYDASAQIHTINVEASTLGLGIGQWPERVTIEGQRFVSGVTLRDDTGAIAGVEYHPIASDFPLVVRVWND